MRSMREVAKNTLEGTRMWRQQGGNGKYHGLSTGINTLDRISSVGKEVTWRDIVSRFLHRLEELTGTDAAEIDVEDGLLIEEICGNDMTGV